MTRIAQTQIGDQDFWNWKVRQVQGWAGIEPWSAILQARYDTNWDYGWDHSMGPDAARHLIALEWAQNPLMTNSPWLRFEGALSLYRLYMKHAENGEELDFEFHPKESEAIINQIIKDSFLLPEFVWHFFQHLIQVFKERGISRYLHPVSLKAAESQTDANPVGEMLDLAKNVLKWAAIIGIGYLVWKESD